MCRLRPYIISKVPGIKCLDCGREELFWWCSDCSSIYVPCSDLGSIHHDGIVVACPFCQHIQNIQPGSCPNYKRHIPNNEQKQSWERRAVTLLGLCCGCGKKICLCGLPIFSESLGEQEIR